GIVVPYPPCAVKQTWQVERSENIAHARPVRCSVLTQKEIRKREKCHVAHEMKLRQIVLAPIHSSAEVERMPAFGPHQVILKCVEVLGELKSLAVSPQGQAARDHDSGYVVVECWNVHSHIREVEGHLLIGIDELTVIGNLRLVKQIAGEQISMREREVPEVGGREEREARRCGRAKIVRRKRSVVMAVGKEEAGCELAFLGLQKIAIGHELLFRESAWRAECAGSLCGKGLARIDSLRPRYQIAAIRQFVLHQR